MQARTAVVVALLLAAGCTRTVVEESTTTAGPGPSTASTVAAPATVACPTGEVSVSVSLRWQEITAATAFPGAAALPLVEVSASGRIVNDTSALVAIVGPTVEGALRSGGGFAVIASSPAVGLAPGSSTTFAGSTDTDSVPAGVSSVGAFVWKSPSLARCGLPPVRIS